MNSVREGYKMTELGEIPSEWEVKKLKELLDVLKDGTHNPPKRTEEGIPLLSAENIFNGKINYGINEKCISEEDYELMHKNYNIEKDDILMTIVGTIGRVAVVKDNKKFTVQRSVAILRSNKKVNNLFLTQFLSSTICKKELDRKSNSTAQAGLYLGELGKINIIVPSINEQEKIASILLTVDEQIDNVDALIEKNKELKKGLMQTLLTKGIGHTKFKKTEIGEIPEEWEIEYLDNMAKRYSGHTPNKQKEEYWNGNIPWISLKDTKKLDKLYINETEDYTTELGIQNSSTVKLPKGTVVISRDATVGKVGITKSKDMATSQHFINYVCSNSINNVFLYYYLFNKKPLFERIGVGSTIKTIGLSFFKELKITVPSIEEQEKIASILFKIDEKIEEYQNKKQKLEEIKKGLMQQLLTGKIRVL